MKQVCYCHRFLTFYARMPLVSMKLLNWQFQYWYFNKYFISYTGWCYELIWLKGYWI